MLRRFRSFPSAARSLMKAAEAPDVRVISFDVFDTLLHRRLAPDLVVEGVARELARVLTERGVRPAVDPMQARHTAYADIASAKVHQGLDQDMTLEELMPAWVRRAAGRVLEDEAQVAEMLIERELDFELASCFGNPVLREACRSLKDRGKRLIYVSDMYLGRKRVEPLLEQNGFAGLFATGYVSGDCSLLKRTGRLFDKILAEEKLEPVDLLHLGDHPESDGTRAHEKGIRAYVVEDRKSLKRRNRLLYDQRRLHRDGNWVGVAAAAFAQAQPADSYPAEQSYGLRLLGPVMCTFVHRVIERAMQERVGQVLFMAREGFLLKALYEELAPVVARDKTAPPAAYLPASRLSTMVAGMTGYGLRELTAAMDNTGSYSVRTLLAPLRLPESRLAEIAARHGVQDVDEPLPPFFLSWPPFYRILEDPELTGHVRGISVEARALLIDYLRQLGFFDCSRVALVDVGWSGQIQDSLYAALNGLEKRPQILGMYLGVRSNAHRRKAPDSWIEGLLCDGAKLNWHANSALEFVQLFEVVPRAHHGTVLGYRREGADGLVSPVLREDTDPARQAEMADDPTVALMQAGVRQYAARYRDFVRIVGATGENSIRYAAASMDRLVRFPTKLEASWFLGMANVSDLGSAEVLSLGAEQHRLHWFQRARRLASLVRSSFWRYGVLSFAFRPAAQGLYVLRTALRLTPRRGERLATGIVWTRRDTVPDVPSVRVPDSRVGLTRLPVEQQSEERYRQVLTEVNRARQTEPAEQRTGPLTLFELTTSYLTYVAGGLLLRLRGRHPVAYGSIPMRAAVSRYLAGHPVAFRMLGWVNAVRARLKAGQSDAPVQELPAAASKTGTKS